MSGYATFDVNNTTVVVHKIDVRHIHKAELLAYNGRHLSYVYEGKFYSSRIDRVGYMGRRWHNHLELMKDAIRLGVLPKKPNLERVVRIEEERKAREYRKYALDEVLNRLAVLGYKLEPKQMIELNRIVKRGKK